MLCPQITDQNFHLGSPNWNGSVVNNSTPIPEGSTPSGHCTHKLILAYTYI
ncbi:hypothetical protein I79_016183 [Cricetulus griseus]|uniref:Uncharacterized protein n=1 Tax=Cricetulus griseus TaxID=10029 RepID=G3HYP2_CRIGR|nr:hypothetical protein I79_016183 [Cricetulus griseus]